MMRMINFDLEIIYVDTLMHAASMVFVPKYYVTIDLSKVNSQI